MLPVHIKPMLATAGPVPREQDDWAFELKWDGIRAVAYWDGTTLRLESRNLRDITVSWPELDNMGPALGQRDVVLDGEIVALDERGAPSFQRLQERMHISSRAAATQLASRVPAAYLAFDVLHVGRASTMTKPWADRRAVLEDLGVTGPCWATPPAFVGAGDETVAAAAQGRIEGVVAKRIDSTYTPGVRSRHWLKIKQQRRDEFVVCGWHPGEGRRAGAIGSLALGLPTAEGGMRYVGGVGTGFSDRELRRLGGVLTPLQTTENPFTENRQHVKRAIVFVEAQVVVDVEYTERTNEGILRHPSYKGQRIDKSPSDVNTDVVP